MKSFREYLAEEATDNISHYTSFDNLIDILKSEFIKGKKYYGNKVDMNIVNNWKNYKNNDEDGVEELCMVRKGKASSINQIACHKPEAKIIFDWDNIKNIRNIKKPYPIAEYGLRPLRAFARQLKYYEKYITKQEADKAFTLFKKTNKTKEDIDNFINNLQANEDLKKELSVSDPAFIPQEEFFKLAKEKRIPDQSYEKRAMIRNLESYLNNSNDFSSIREGEERLNLSKAKIPVDSKFIKIILPKDYRKKAGLYNASIIEKYINKNPDLFIFKDKI